MNNDTFTFGKYKGQSYEEVYQHDPDYIAWLAEKSFSPSVKRVASAVIHMHAQHEKAEAEQLQKACLLSLSSRPPGGALTPYRYITTTVQRGAVCIELCTHQLRTAHGFSEVLHTGDWDIVEIRNTQDDGSDEDEEDEYAVQESYHEYRARHRRASLTTPKAEDRAWYAFCDNSGQYPLNPQPVTLHAALTLLETFLASPKKGR